MKKVDFVIRGMSCGSCVNKVTATLKSIPRVTVDKVAVGSATVLIDPSQTPPDRLVKALAAVGFTAEAIPLSGKVSQAQ